MTDGSRATLFISYSHSQRDDMLQFRKHLEGQLYGKGLVWSDEKISRGSRWESQLRGQLKNSDAALLLVSPDFLASEWCRRELSIIAAEQKAGRLKKVFWVQIEPCGWRGTELATFQSWDFNLADAVNTATDATARQRTMVRICEDIASEMEAVGAQLDRDLSFVRQVLADYALDHGLVVDSSLSEGQGTFATVCRGRKGTEDVAIKVLRGSQIKQLSQAFNAMVSTRTPLNNQCFIRVLDHFPVETQQDEFSVVVEEFVGSDVVRLHQFLEEKRKLKQTLPVDEVATVVRRTAEALRQFHSCRPGGQRSYGLLTPRHVYYDQRGQKLMLPVVGVSNFLWDAIGWERLATWQDETPNLASYVAPEIADGQPATEQTDQYMLGQLAFEMLEGRLPFDISRPSDVQKKAPFWDDPEKMASGEWVDAHRAFAKIVFRMLRRDPARRWRTLEDLRRRLLTLEDENRALAKRTFNGLDGFQLKDNQAFFQAFYREFFRRAPEAKAKFKRPDDQPKKLMDSMIAVLNYRDSNEPTPLRGVIDSHQHLGITPKQVEHFRDTFLDTLRKKMPRGMTPARREQILAAWDDLFAPVVEYFKEELPAPSRETADDDAASTPAAAERRRSSRVRSPRRRPRR